MPKPHTFPFIYNDIKCITISDLKKLGYIKPNINKVGSIRWTDSKGVETSSITVQSKINNSLKVLIIDYKCNNKKSFNYTIPLVTIPSNLGKGKVWYFICPFTYKRCRKLHLIDCHFIHRTAIRGVYEKQIHSKKWRVLDNTFNDYFKIDDYYQELYSKHFTKYYKGKPTKRYLRLMKKINKAENISADEIENLFLL